MQRKKVKEAVKVLLQSNSEAEAYQKLHPNSKPINSQKNAARFFGHPQIVEELNVLLDNTESMVVNKENLIKMLGKVIKGKYEGKERTSDFLKAIEILSKLVPEFVDRKVVSDYEVMPEEDLDRAIKEKFKLFGDKTDETPTA